MAILDPGIKVDPGYPVYDEALRENLFLKYPNDKPVIAPVWPGKCLFPRFHQRAGAGMVGRAAFDADGRRASAGSGTI